eukprot:109851-Prorocentrum_minimum.AAC.1
MAMAIEGPWPPRPPHAVVPDRSEFESEPAALRTGRTPAETTAHQGCPALGKVGNTPQSPAGLGLR